jgi:hypothetical protein
MRVFKEIQSFNQSWLIILILISVFIPFGILLATYIKNPKDMSISLLLTVLLVLLAASSIIFLFKLTTRIDHKGIYYKFFPFHWKSKLIAWSEIEDVYVRRYDAISEYGGWGLKGGAFWKKSLGVAINVSGDIGIQLVLKNGKKILIGTKKQEQAQQILRTYKSKLFRIEDANN